jgi:hypothetical protein
MLNASKVPNDLYIHLILWPEKSDTKKFMSQAPVTHAYIILATQGGRDWGGGGWRFRQIVQEFGRPCLEKLTTKK